MYNVILHYQDGHTFICAEDAIQAREQAKADIGKADLLGRVLSAVSIIKKDCL
ncbi:Uncharacterised protein [[Actinobacillus] rossii]|uniref:Uncharacterized protein n=1 Tax=[Actinobacillus] rossii TaxID=123820 RepID=A0A380TML5_9PAST|nr:hypothetical protein [[Actinobacillus] rossii]SUT88604.1 Uncharacterised protein [[Actinobacillus] rossii]